MCNTGLCGILKNCVLIFIYIYGTCHISFEMIQTIVPVGFILIGVFTFGLYVIKVPPPDEDTVKKIIGLPLVEESENPTEYYMKTVAHRGAGLDAPENSLVAFDLCNKKGCNIIEFDVALTADDVPVIFHDKTLDRVADSEKMLSKTLWEDLQKIDISVRHPYSDRFVNTMIPTLDETVQQLLKAEQRMFIDIKTQNGKIIDIMLDLYEKYPSLHSMAVVTSFYPNIIYYIRRSNPRIVCSLAWRPHCFANVSYNAITGRGERRTNNIVKHLFLCLCDNIHEWLLPRLTYSILGLSVVLLHKDVVSPKVVADWQAKGVRVMAWTVNHPVEKQYFAKTLKITYMTDTLTGESTVHANSSD
ncbi:hypothetical protein RI129_000933 [Pyrocoelia pectoralis]|uniref:GP-PDE domain-containing protein n=1 Tax=Pyrocoelia pectoralis TaxID=417401 RepID=A0AAN7VUE8_9COLE